MNQIGDKIQHGLFTCANGTVTFKCIVVDANKVLNQVMKFNKKVIENCNEIFRKPSRGFMLID